MYRYLKMYSRYDHNKDKEWGVVYQLLFQKFLINPRRFTLVRMILINLRRVHLKHVDSESEFLRVQCA